MAAWLRGFVLFMLHFAVFISHLLESLGTSPGNKTGTKLQLVEVAFVFTR